MHGRHAPSPPHPPTPTLHAADYWGWFKPARAYHHTGPVSTYYALREALALVSEEGLPAMWDRHLQVRARCWLLHACNSPLAG
jgi:aspartate aminotransferase-like enzyme